MTPGVIMRPAYSSMFTTGHIYGTPVRRRNYSRPAFQWKKLWSVASFPKNTSLLASLRGTAAGEFFARLELAIWTVEPAVMHQH